MDFSFSLYPERASTLAGWVDGVFLYGLAITVFFTGLICVLVLFFAVKYRRGSRADRSNPKTHNTPLEIIWITIPTLLALGMFTFSTYVYFTLYDYPKDAIEIYVLGRQWMWELNHPEGRREINQLHIPVGKPVKLTMTSVDVIHSFFVPAFRVKQDAVPGRYTTMWFQATKPGRYHLFCTEYCGTLHSGMIGSVVVMEPQDYQEWLSSGYGRDETMADAGAQLFTRYGCNGCHGPNATVRAPMLQGVYGHAVPLASGKVVTADERYIRDSILLPKNEVVAGYDPVMPTYEGQIDEGDLLKIIAYIRSIGNVEKVEQR